MFVLNLLDHSLLGRGGGHQSLVGLVPHDVVLDLPGLGLLVGAIVRPLGRLLGRLLGAVLVLGDLDRLLALVVGVTGDVLDEGVDERVLESRRVIEVSLGDFVLTGGEIAAQAMIDATVRLLPDILGNEASIAEESHMAGLLEHPHYTRPALWNGRSMPDVLQSGHHINIAKWRQEMSQQVTKEKRPDLWAAFQNALGKPDPKD